MTLRLGFKPGETLRYRFQQKNEIKVKANGQETGNTSDLAILFLWTVRAVDATGTAEVAQKIERVTVALSVGSKTYKLDTRDAAEKDDPAARPLSQVYRAALRRETTLKVDSRGQIRDVVVPPEVTEALRGSPFESSADGGSVFTPAGVRNMLAQVIPTLPEASVKPGATWKTDLELPTGLLRIRLSNDARLAKLGPTAEIESNLSTELVPVPGNQISVTLKSQKGQAHYLIDNPSKRLTEAGLKQTIEMTLTLGKNAIEQSSVATTSLKLVP